MTRSFVSSAAFVPTGTVARQSSSSSIPENLHGSLSQDGKRFRPEPLAMIMPTGFEGELFGLLKDTLTAGATGGAGDVIAQLADKSRNNDEDDKDFFFSEEKEPFDLDVRRTLSYATFAAGYTGAFQHVVFANLQETFSDPVIKLALNQGLIIPLCYYSLFVFLVPKLRARSAAEEETLRSSIDVFAMIPKNWLFWVPLQFIQFNYIPTEFQVIYCSFLGLIWNIILSFLTSGAKAKTEPPPLPETALITAGSEAIEQPAGFGGIFQTAQQAGGSENQK
ncbi:Peroxisomal membrane protein 2 [Seminavis robusta]|uniref:Peroxisomal membrane protein 2 n=1 Tax=Seminavis robusta TaxID=568900 RepID=A0A9N8DZF3_9STRA|nr:Peroxisomal membrane protein 2 [Seminavis robusta]|eukprot:Sro499_g155110.1 Peroxisomal membrane protein 2 (279) ;mRNA; f:39273-40109